jgi:hypothetical protein
LYDLSYGKKYSTPQRCGIIPYGSSMFFRSRVLY